MDAKGLRSVLLCSKDGKGSDWPEGRQETVKSRAQFTHEKGGFCPHIYGFLY